jgi:RNA polymerase sigma-70 factor (ECF subfamily)
VEFSDEELVEQCKKELPYITDAFELLLRRYEPTVHRTCLRFLRNHHEAEEASQDAFLRAFHGLRNFRGGSTFRTWLYRVVTNVCATRYQKRKRQSESRAAYIEHVKAGHTDHASSTPESDDDLLSGPIADALETLSTNDQQALVLRHVTDLTVPEIAEVTELSLSAAKMRVARAEERLRTAYEGIVGKKLDFSKGL